MARIRIALLTIAAAAALAAVRRWRHKPTIVNGVAVPIITTATVTFQ